MWRLLFQFSLILSPSLPGTPTSRCHLTTKTYSSFNFSSQDIFVKPSLTSADKSETHLPSGPRYTWHKSPRQQVPLVLWLPGLRFPRRLQAPTMQGHVSSSCVPKWLIQCLVHNRHLGDIWQMQNQNVATALKSNSFFVVKSQTSWLLSLHLNLQPNLHKLY